MTAAFPDLPVRDPLEDFDRVSESLSDWVTIVWNDPVNTMTFVTYVFMTYFGYSRERAERLMMQVHTKGSAIVAEGSREAMEIHVQAMHGYGLWATLKPAES
jgi:ATP-dependent Clp protease adaptor protein ClpS